MIDTHPDPQIGQRVVLTRNPLTGNGHIEAKASGKRYKIRFDNGGYAYVGRYDFMPVASDTAIAS